MANTNKYSFLVVLQLTGGNDYLNTGYRPYQPSL